MADVPDIERPLRPGPGIFEPLKSSKQPDIDPVQLMVSSRGPATNALIEQAPAVMAELTSQLIQHTDVRIRERLRKQIRAIFDFIQADTTHPGTSVLEDSKRKDGFA